MAKLAERWSVKQGDVLKGLPFGTDTIDAVVTDPPYELGIFGEKWDATGVSFRHQTWKEILRVAKPGAYLMAFGGSRTFHRIACAIEDAGWRITDHLQWLHSQGFPRVKSVLKPAYEPIILAQKPMPRTGKKNVEQLGTGVLQIDRCRVNGLWPANVMIDEVVAEHNLNLSRFLFVAKPTTAERDLGCGTLPTVKKKGGMKTAPDGTPKEPSEGKNFHPTVKPVSVMEWLCKLVTPPRGIVLDPFMGSGTTGVAAMRMGFQFRGIDLNPDYLTIAKARIKHAAGTKAAQVNWRSA